MSAITSRNDALVANPSSSSNEMNQGDLNGRRVESKLTGFDRSKVLDAAFNKTLGELKKQGPEISEVSIREALTNSQREAYATIFAMETKEEWENYFIENFDCERPLPEEVQDFIQRRENEYLSVARKKIDTLEGAHLVAELDELEKKLKHDTFTEIKKNIEFSKRNVQGWGGHGSSGSRTISSGYSKTLQFANLLEVKYNLSRKLEKTKMKRFSDFETLYRSLLQLIPSKDREKAAEANGDALIKQEEAEKQTKASKDSSTNKRQNSKRRKRRPSASQANKLPQESTKVTTTQGKISAKVDSMDRLQTLALELQKMDSTFKLQHRVMRWKKATPEEIKTFGMKYQNPSMDLHLARALHCLPGLEISLSCEKIRDTYFFPTDRGFGTPARMFDKNTNNLITDGIIYVGINKSKNSIYHMFFTPTDQLPLDERAIISGKVKSYAMEIRETPEQEKENSIELPWTHTSDYEFNFLKNKNNEIELKITFLQDDRYIRLLPL